MKELCSQLTGVIDEIFISNVDKIILDNEGDYRAQSYEILSYINSNSSVVIRKRTETLIKKQWEKVQKERIKETLNNPENKSKIENAIDSIRELSSQDKIKYEENTRHARNRNYITANGYKNAVSLTVIQYAISELDIEDYFDGPSEDHDKTKQGDVWEFKKMLYLDGDEEDGSKVYLKVRLNLPEELVCISLHDDIIPIKFSNVELD